jgi:hypothetical protein
MRCAVVQCPPVGRDGSTTETTADKFEKVGDGHDPDGAARVDHDQTANRPSPHHVSTIKTGEDVTVLSHAMVGVRSIVVDRYRYGMSRLAWAIAAAIAVPFARRVTHGHVPEPFVVDDRGFRERFNVKPVGVDTAAAETIEWATQHYGHAAAPPTSG